MQSPKGFSEKPEGKLLSGRAAGIAAQAQEKPASKRFASRKAGFWDGLRVKAAEKKFAAKKFLKKLMGTSGYPYTNTRVRVMKTRLLKENDFRKMLKMSVPELAAYLNSSDYGREISELAPMFEGSNLLEYSLNRNLENTFNKILAFSIKSPGEQAKLYLKRFDVFNVKTFLRGKFSGKSNEDILLELVCAGSLKREFFEKACRESDGLEGAVAQLKATEVFGIAKSFKTDLSRLEDELDKYYYEKVFVESEAELENFISDEILVKNTLNWLRAKKSELKMERLPRGSKRKIALPKEGDCVENRVFLKQFLLKRGYEMVNMYKRSIRPVLGYFIAKENEIGNIRMIVRGKSSGLAAEMIEQQLVF